jgi:hypothetical protein
MTTANTLIRQMRHQIRLVNTGKPYDEKMPDALATCIEEGYITGITLRYNARGNPCFDIRQPRVTLKGLQFYSYRKVTLRSTIGFIGAIVNFLILLLDKFTPFPDMISKWIASLLG